MKAIVLTQEERDRLAILRDRIMKFSYEIGKDKDIHLQLCFLVGALEGWTSDVLDREGDAK